MGSGPTVDSLLSGAIGALIATVLAVLYQHLNQGQTRLIFDVYIALALHGVREGTPKAENKSDVYRTS